jgi:hypothetical protein
LKKKNMKKTNMEITNMEITVKYLTGFHKVFLPAKSFKKAKLR